MPELVTIRRNLGPPRALVKGEYTLETPSGNPLVCCPECGDYDELARMPDASGVFGRWACPGRGCEFNRFITLEHAHDEVAA